MRLRYVLLPAIIAIAGCGQSNSSFSQIGERTYRIESEPIPGGASGPNRRTAQALCPGGFRVLDSASNKGGPDRAIFDQQNTTTIWVIKCL
jgi:hypothetical protein